MSTSLTPYQVHVLKSHVEVVLLPPLTEGSWSEIEQLGNEVLGQIQERRSPVCIIDLSGLNYMGSSMVALMVRIWKEVKSRNGRLVIVATHPVVRETISLAGLDKIWEIHGRMDTACRSLRVTPASASSEHSSRTSLRRRLLIGIVLVIAAIAGVSVAFFAQQS